MRLPLALCSMFAATVLAQDPVPEESKPHAEPRIQHDATTLLLPPGTYEIDTLVDAGAEFLGWNILSNPADYAHIRLKLQKQMRMNKGTVEEALCELLFNKGLALVAQNPDQNLYEVVALGGVKGRAAIQRAPFRSNTEILKQPHLKQPVTTTIRLHHIHATVCLNALRPLFAAAKGNAAGKRARGAAGGASSPGLTFSWAGGQDVMIRGMQHEVAHALEVIRELDGEQPGEVVDVQTSVKKLREQIRELQAQLDDLLK